jgi:hypothetical protein
MPMKRVQFQKGLSMPEFLDRDGTEERCEQALVAARWPSGFVSPARGVMESRTTFRRQGRLYWQCAGCQHQCSVTSGTVFGSTKLPLTRCFLAMQLLTQSKNNVSALELKRQIGGCYRTAWLVKHKLLEVMRLVEADRQLTGRVEVDDAYLGGQRSGGKTGRGSENKVPFAAVVQATEDGRPHLACLSPRPFTKQALEDFFARSPTAWVASTSLPACACHDRTVTGGGKASVELEQFRCVNTLISSIKTALSGTYHSVKFVKYAHRYFAEVQFRFNRRCDLRAILGSLVHAMVAAPPSRGRGIRVAEHGR